jgi:hypothetical protein
MSYNMLTSLLTGSITDQQVVLSLSGNCTSIIKR